MGFFLECCAISRIISTDLLVCLQAQNMFRSFIFLIREKKNEKLAKNSKTMIQKCVWRIWKIYSYTYIDDMFINIFNYLFFFFSFSTSSYIRYRFSVKKFKIEKLKTHSFFFQIFIKEIFRMKNNNEAMFLLTFSLCGKMSDLCHFYNATK